MELIDNKTIDQSSIEADGNIPKQCNHAEDIVFVLENGHVGLNAADLLCDETAGGRRVTERYVSLQKYNLKN